MERSAKICQINSLMTTVEGRISFPHCSKQNLKCLLQLLECTLTELDLKDHSMQYIVAAVGHPQLFSHHRDGSDIGKGGRGAVAVEFGTLLKQR